MIWFFEKDRTRLHYEIRHAEQVAGTAFELVVTYPDGRQQIERAHDPRDLVARSGSLRSALVRDGWRSIGAR
jgi:hypothetical protein